MTAPKLTDQFWFDYSASMVTDSIERLNTAIDSIKKFTYGLLFFYPATTIAVIEYKHVDNLWVLLLFVAPYVVVLFSAWQGTSSVVPKSVSFDPRVPEDIRQAYLVTHTYKEKELKKAVTISLLTTVLASLALIIGVVLENFHTRQENEKKLELARLVELEKERGAHYFDADYQQVDNKVSITGYFPPDKKLVVSVTNYYSDGKKIEVYNEPHVNTKKGVFAINIPLHSVGEKSIVQVIWPDSGFSRAIIKEISTK